MDGEDILDPTVGGEKPQGLWHVATMYLPTWERILGFSLRAGGSDDSDSCYGKGMPQERVHVLCTVAGCSLITFLSFVLSPLLCLEH